MRLFPNMSLRWKQQWIIMLTCGLALALACAAFITYDAFSFRREIVERVSSLAEVVGKNNTAAIDFNDSAAAEQTLAALQGEAGIVMAHVHTSGDALFASYHREGAALPPETPHAIQEHHEFTPNHLHLFRPITQGGEQIGTIELVASLDAFRVRLWRYLGIVVAVFAAAMFVAFWLSAALGRVVSGPIMHLAQVARSIAQDKNYSVRATKGSDDELGQLVDGFNEMLAEIQERDFALQAARDTLEHSVRERTAELAGANQSLQQEVGERERAQSFLNSVVEHLPIPVFIKEAKELRFVLWNKAGEKLTGISNAEMIGRNDFDFFPQADAERNVAKDRAAFASKDVLEIPEEILQTRGHGARLVHVWKVPIFDAAGQPAFLLGIAEDITERKRAESTALAFSRLGRQLSGAASREAAARSISEVSDEIFGWDAFSIQLYSREDDTVCSIFEVDTIEGRRIEDADNQPRKSAALHHRIFKSGAELVLRDGKDFLPGAQSFGNQSRPSASLMYVPIRAGDAIVGLLSVHSYTPGAYTKQNLTTLQTLADHCGSALKRIEADEALRRTEELYRQAITGADAVPYSYRFETKSYAFMGAAIQRLIGYTAEEMNPELWKSIIQESVMQGEAAGMKKAEAAQLVSRGELRHWRCDMLVTTRDGRLRWLADSSVQELDAAGKPVGSMGILQDITERKQAEVTAKAFSKLGRELSCATSGEVAARVISEAADELFGWDACSIQVYSHADDTVRCIFETDTFEGARVETLNPNPRKGTALHHRIFQSGAELILRDPATFLPEATPFGNRSRPSASLMYVPIRTAREIVGLMSIQSYSPNAYTEQNLATLQTLADQCSGALQRLRVDEALRESESQFRLVWDTSVDGMRLANRDGTVLMANDAYCRMVGKTKAEIEGQPLTLIHCAEKAEQILRNHRQQIDTGKSQSHLEVDATLWNGRKVWFEMSNSKLDLPGHPALLLSIFRDITGRKQAEVELESMHRQLLGVSRQAGMAEVATSVLHNVGNVLNSVNTSASVLADRLRNSQMAGVSRVTELLEANRHDLAGFLTANGRADQVINFLKSLAQHLTAENASALAELQGLTGNIEHIKEIIAMQQSYARISGVTEKVKPTDLVEDALRMNAGALARHQVQLLRDYAPDLPEIVVEKHKVLQILVNLIRNAKYACDDSGRADLQLTVRVANGDGRVRIVIQDNGVGIPVENLTRIFNHGFTTRKNGHGFGLHNGALAAKEMGGSLTAHSEGPGQGATFTLELPL